MTVLHFDRFDSGCACGGATVPTDGRSNRPIAILYLCIALSLFILAYVLMYAYFYKSYILFTLLPNYAYGFARDFYVFFS